MQLRHSVIAAAVAIVLASMGGEARATGSAHTASPGLRPTVAEARGAFLQQGQSIDASGEESRLTTPEKKTKQPKQPKLDDRGIVFDHVMLDEIDHGFIVPCVKVLTKLFQQAKHNDSIGVELRLTYTSKGKVIQKLFVAPLSEYQITTHHQQPKQKKWKLVDAELDVSSKMPDTGTTFTGTAKLVYLGAPAASANDGSAASLSPKFDLQSFVALSERRSSERALLPNIEIPGPTGTAR